MEKKKRAEVHFRPRRHGRSTITKRCKRWSTRAYSANDTTVMGNKEELEQGAGTMKEVMGWFEERNNEELNFGKEGIGKIRMLGSWMVWKVDVDERLKRLGG